MKKCKFCLTKASENESICSVCKIDFSKKKGDLTKEEKKISYYCRGIRIVGFLNMVTGILIFLFALNAIFFPANNPPKINLYLVLILAGFFIYFGYCLRLFEKWCFYGAIVIYGIVILLDIISLNILGLLMAILFLSYIANPTSKKILYRTV